MHLSRRLLANGWPAIAACRIDVEQQKLLVQLLLHPMLYQKILVAIKWCRTPTQLCCTGCYLSTMCGFLGVPWIGSHSSGLDWGATLVQPIVVDVSVPPGH